MSFKSNLASLETKVFFNEKHFAEAVTYKADFDALPISIVVIPSNKSTQTSEDGRMDTKSLFCDFSIQKSDVSTPLVDGYITYGGLDYKIISIIRDDKTQSVVTGVYETIEKAHG